MIFEQVNNIVDSLSKIIVLSFLFYLLKRLLLILKVKKDIKTNSSLVVRSKVVIAKSYFLTITHVSIVIKIATMFDLVFMY